MLKISKKTDYGLIFLSYLSKQPDNTFTSLRTVSDETHVPYKFLSQIAIDLKHADIIDSKEGFGGGYSLKKPSDQITIYEILSTLEGPVAITGCQRGKDCNCQDSCIHKNTMVGLNQVIIQNLEDQTLADLAKE